MREQYAPFKFEANHLSLLETNEFSLCCFFDRSQLSAKEEKRVAPTKHDTDEDAND